MSCWTLLAEYSESICLKNSLRLSEDHSQPCKSPGYFPPTLSCESSDLLFWSYCFRSFWGEFLAFFSYRYFFILFHINNSIKGKLQICWSFSKSSHSSLVVSRPWSILVSCWLWHEVEPFFSRERRAREWLRLSGLQLLDSNSYLILQKPDCQQIAWGRTEKHWAYVTRKHLCRSVNVFSVILNKKKMYWPGQ